MHLQYRIFRVYSRIGGAARLPKPMLTTDLRIHLINARRLAAVAVLAVVAAAPASDARPGDRDALRHIVVDECLVHWMQQHDPAPCERVYLSDAQRGNEGYAVLADIKGGAHFLLIPTTTVAGVESPEILAAQAPNYFAGAWQARDRVAAFLGYALRRDEAGFAINPQRARGQDQLHIHIECLGREIQRVLRGAAERLNDSWSPVELAGRQYQGVRVMGTELGRSNPFTLLAERMPGAREDMGAYTLLLAGMQFKAGPGFIILAGRNLPGAENFLDATCAVTKHRKS
jgi:CDP-diacylglycerol pyrophosphatase